MAARLLLGSYIVDIDPTDTFHHAFLIYDPNTNNDNDFFKENNFRLTIFK